MLAVRSTSHLCSSDCLGIAAGALGRLQRRPMKNRMILWKGWEIEDRDCVTLWPYWKRQTASGLLYFA